MEQHISICDLHPLHLQSMDGVCSLFMHACIDITAIIYSSIIIGFQMFKGSNSPVTQYHSGNPKQTTLSKNTPLTRTRKHPRRRGCYS
ncbi:hypothetical protein BO99DRAFT_268697 [Aspergillus violaceofuscus CBS 115571]|uniref:Uncharacterized protein n=1 Tax=Aspergillus violaceofuscus (strain CBS 115571) TaxID=1450538 RepID=A0A2V5GZW2_ASPV1|nr:hypothetical protein BO99DRAFT_268697 [Aspergillus violaceofuscus CBS 115571]